MAMGTSDLFRLPLILFLKAILSGLSSMLGKGFTEKRYTYQCNGKGRTAIVWSESSLNNVESTVLRAEAPHFIAFGVSFKYFFFFFFLVCLQQCGMMLPLGSLLPHKIDRWLPDQIAFYHCGFHSTHNTLFDYKGRHYYDNCYIQGSVDFIFGHGRSVFHSCEIFVIGDKRVKIRGSVTAQNRESENDYSGFSFVKGKVYSVCLGRAKGPHSRVFFAKTYLSKTIAPQGWINWSYDGSTENLFHAEYKCHGPGSESKERAAWSRELTEEEVAPFLFIDCIDGTHWLPVWL
ncbi:hypothetical protein SO802_010314 [Lithocarpus litseifolius]|uniref:Pectinesterase n=1 Tax=Lithocarpus litseifolius TaxID=425828 RepID=A0AAW2DDX3_9ROSI